MAGRFSIIVAVVLAMFSGQSLFAADAALEKTIEKAKEKRQAEIDKAGGAYHASVERANGALLRVLETALAKAKQKGDDARVAAITADIELLKTGEAPTSGDGGDKLLEGATKRRVLDIETADKTFKATVARANATLETSYKAVINGYKKKDEARGNELAAEIETIKTAEVTPVKSEGSASAKPKGNGSVALIKEIGPKLVNAAGKEVTSASLADKEYVLIYYSASWCGPCRAFTPDLVKFHEEYSKKANIEVILVSSDRSEDAMLKYMDEAKMPWLSVPYNKADSFSYARSQNVSGIPHLALLDKNGNLVSNAVENGQYVGPRKVLADLKSKLGVR